MAIEKGFRPFAPGPLRSAGAGFIAGMAFLVFAVVASVVMGSEPLYFLRMAAAMVLGGEALEPWYSLFAAAALGFLVHAALSLVFGLVFGTMLRKGRRRYDSRFGLVSATCIYGSLLWGFNYLVIAPVIGWSWFLFSGNPLLVGLVGHTLVFGGAYGIFLARYHSKEHDAGESVYA